jgi:uncharacterized membrane protein
VLFISSENVENIGRNASHSFFRVQKKLYKKNLIAGLVGVYVCVISLLFAMFSNIFSILFHFSLVDSILLHSHERSSFKKSISFIKNFLKFTKSSINELFHEKNIFLLYISSIQSSFV